MYRTKIFNILYNNYLKPIMRFTDISLSDDKECGLLKIVGADRRENGKVVPTYFRNIYNNDKIYTIVRSQDEFINYRSRREDLDYFNPFVKYKNALMLLLMCTPKIYEMVVNDSSGDEDDIINVIVDDELNVTQEDIVNKVKIKQYAIEKNVDDESIYKYSISFASDTDENWIQIDSASNNKIVAVLMLIIKTMAYFDEPLDVVDTYGGNFSSIEEELKMLLEKYSKERELNRKDIKKIKFDKDVEMFQSDEFDLFDENSVEDALTPSDNDETVKENTDNKTGTIDISNIYRDAIPLYEKGDDDDIVDLDYF